MKKKIDVLIPAYKTGKEFEELLKRLMKQTILPNHIYILQTLSTPDEQLMHFSEERISVHPIRKEDFDHGGTRHYGSTLAQGDYLLYMTQDAMPEDEYLLENLLAAFTEEKVAVAYARQLPREGADIIESMTRLHNYPEESITKSLEDLPQLGIKTYFCSDVCAMYDKSVYEEMGGFVRKTIFNEDMIMASRVIQAGYKVAYRADAKVIHSHSYTCRQQFTRNFDLGVSQRQYREVFAKISSEKEGAGYAKKVLMVLLKKGKVFKAFYFAMQCAFKLAGYKLGVHYDRLPKRVVRWCTMSPGYWN